MQSLIMLRVTISIGVHKFKASIDFRLKKVILFEVQDKCDVSVALML